jgi:hypothetical protein
MMLERKALSYALKIETDLKNYYQSQQIFVFILEKQ